MTSLSLSLYQLALDESAIAAATSDPSSQQAYLQQGLEKILSAAAELAGSESTRDYRQHSIILHCDEVKEKLQQLLVTFESVGGEGESVEEELERSRVISEGVTDVEEKMSGLRKEVRYDLEMYPTLCCTSGVHSTIGLGISLGLVQEAGIVT